MNIRTTLFLLALFIAGHTSAQVMSLTAVGGASIGINIDDIVIVRPITGGSIILYGQPQAQQKVTQDVATILSRSCGKLVQLDIRESRNVALFTEDALVPIQLILKVIPDAASKALLYMKIPNGAVYTTAISYSATVATIDDCMGGGGGGTSGAANFQSFTVTGSTIASTQTLPATDRNWRIDLYRSGVRMTYLTDFTVVGNTITLVLAGAAEDFTLIVHN